MAFKLRLPRQRIEGPDFKKSLAAKMRKKTMPMGNKMKLNTGLAPRALMKGM